MDPMLIDVYKQMAKRHHCSVDDILCDPNYRLEFLDASRRRLGDERPEFDILHRLSDRFPVQRLPFSAKFSVLGEATRASNRKFIPRISKSTEIV